MDSALPLELWLLGSKEIGSENLNRLSWVCGINYNLFTFDILYAKINFYFLVSQN
jgi:hypothetical protein